MVMRLLALSASLLSMTAAGSAAAQACGDVPTTTIEYVGFNPAGLSADDRGELESSVGELVARFSLRCGYRVLLTVRRRHGAFEVTPSVESTSSACTYTIRVREDGLTRTARGRRLADAISEAAALGSEVRRRHCPDP
jgi:hypothetical protein